MKKKALKKPSELFSVKTDKLARKVGKAIFIIGSTMTSTLALITDVDKKWIIFSGSLTATGTITTMFFKEEEEDEG
jgi:hypothetical protein